MLAVHAHLVGLLLPLSIQLALSCVPCLGESLHGPDP